MAGVGAMGLRPLGVEQDACYPLLHWLRHKGDSAVKCLMELICPPNALASFPGFF